MFEDIHKMNVSTAEYPQIHIEIHNFKIDDLNAIRAHSTSRGLYFSEAFQKNLGGSKTGRFYGTNSVPFKLVGSCLPTETSPGTLMGSDGCWEMCERTRKQMSRLITALPRWAG